MPVGSRTLPRSRAGRAGFQLSWAYPGNKKGCWRGGFAPAPWDSCFRQRFSSRNRFVRQEQKPSSPDVLSGAQRYVWLTKTIFFSPVLILP